MNIKIFLYFLPTCKSFHVQKLDTSALTSFFKPCVTSHLNKMAFLLCTQGYYKNKSKTQKKKKTSQINKTYARTRNMSFFPKRKKSQNKTKAKLKSCNGSTLRLSHFFHHHYLHSLPRPSAPIQLPIGKHVVSIRHFPALILRMFSFL